MYTIIDHGAADDVEYNMDDFVNLNSLEYYLVIILVYLLFFLEFLG
jgi:hypothetical protein